MRALFLLATLGIGLCGQPRPFDPEIEVPLGDPFVLRIEQSATIAGTPLRLEFEEVLEDSRCPADVTCVWQGNARLRLAASVRGEEPVQVELNTGLEPRAATAHGFEIALEQVQPTPASARSIAASDYLATLRVTEN